jgi:hypothetical protein
MNQAQYDEMNFQAMECAREDDPLLSGVYVDDDGIARKERRRKSRDAEDPRIGHLFNGFDNVIHNADDYTKGYVKAMRAEFAELIHSLDR